MRLQLEARTHPSRAMVALSPVIAIALTVVVGGVVFAARGLDPLHALYVYFVEPVMTLWSIEELIVKAAPLVLIGAGLAVCFRANLWNIGAEGQFTAGAIAGGAVPVLAPDIVAVCSRFRSCWCWACSAAWRGPGSRRCSATGSEPTRS